MGVFEKHAAILFKDIFPKNDPILSDDLHVDHIGHERKSPETQGDLRFCWQDSWTAVRSTAAHSSLKPALGWHLALPAVVHGSNARETAV